MRFLILLALGLLPLSALACDEHVNMAAEPVIQVTDAWTRPTPKGAKAAALYLTLSNKSDKPVAILSAVSKAAEKTEIHETEVVDGIAKMRPVPALSVPANGELALKPGGLHVMLIGLKEQFRKGDKVILALQFGNDESMQVAVKVGNPPEKPAAGADDAHEHPHDDESEDRHDHPH